VQLPTSALPLTLKNVMHVPHFNYYLLFVKKLYKDNNYEVDFYFSTVHIKDKATWTTLRQCISDGVIYLLPIPVSHTALLTASTSGNV